MEIKTINRKYAIELMDTIKTTGMSFGVSYIKKDGSIRKMLARLGVAPAPSKTGKPRAYNPERYGLTTVLDVNKTISARKHGHGEEKIYRLVNVNTLMYIRWGGVEYRVKGNELDRDAYKSNLNK